ncbi:MAG: signal recognition particle-docking protein FtsY [Clostridia bacterium]|nr:signal recognition particle-docking protein FtsY [Clostridia bacterium]
MAIFKKINFGLSKTRNKMAGAIDDMLDSFDEFSDDLFVELEEILVMSDVGVETAVTVVEELRSRVRSERIKKPDQIKAELQNIIAELLDGGEDMGLITIPSILLMIGVNGVGKTTTIGKLASMYKAEGKKVILGAADTFRAAAIEQLDEWANRAGVDIVKHKEGADPAAVIFDTIAAGKARDCDIIICDTAGRLHNKKNLMDELAKIYRVIDRELPYSDREILLVLDATTGQNAVNQAREFMGVADLTGIVLTKLDGTARGGVVLSIKNELKLPVKFIGVGEGIDDLQPFDPAAFAKSLFVEGEDHTQEDAEIEKYIKENGATEYHLDDLDPDPDGELRQAFEEILQVYSEIGSESGEDGTDTQSQTDEGAEEAQSETGETRSEESRETNEESREEGLQSGNEGDQEEREIAAQRELEAAQREREAAIKAEEERLAAEKAAEEARIAAEKAEAERLAAEQAEAERLAAEKAEAERLAAEQAEADRLAAEARLAAEKAQTERLAAAKAAAEKLAAEKAEAERLAAEQAAEKKPEEKKRRGLFGLFNRHS